LPVTQLQKQSHVTSLFSPSATAVLTECRTFQRRPLLRRAGKRRIVWASNHSHSHAPIDRDFGARDEIIFG
jgi:hypothetical protein